MRITLTLTLALLAYSVATAQFDRQVNVRSNPTVETIAILMNQISPEFLPDSAADPTGYQRSRAMKLNVDWFSAFDQHLAIQATKTLSDKLGTGIYLLGLYANPLPQQGWQTPVSPLLLAAVHPDVDSAQGIIDQYLTQITSFFHDANVERFLSQQQSTYRTAIRQVQQNRPPKSFIPTMEAYYGVRKGSYNIVVMPFFITDWGMGWQIGEGPDTRLFNISAPYRNPLVQHHQVQDPGYNDAVAIRTLCVHEFGHSFVNPLTMQPQVAQQINLYKALYKPVAGQAQYQDWLTLFNELTVRAGEIRIAVQMGLPKEEQRLQALYRNWPYLDHFITQLKVYETKRVKYATFADFLPVLINSLKEIE